MAKGWPTLHSICRRMQPAGKDLGWNRRELAKLYAQEERIVEDCSELEFSKS